MGLWTAVAWGVDASKAPTMPLVAPVSVPSTWTVNCVLPKVVDAQGSALLVSAQFIYTKDIRCEISTWSDARVLEEWLAKGFLLRRQNGVVSLYDPRAEAFSTTLTTNSFPEFDWISVANFTGVEKVAGRECNVFREGGKSAAIDAETKLPVQLIFNGQTRTYTFGELEKPLMLPPALVEKIAEYQRLLRKVTVNRAPR